MLLYLVYYGIKKSGQPRVDIRAEPPIAALRLEPVFGETLLGIKGHF